MTYTNKETQNGDMITLLEKALENGGTAKVIAIAGLSAGIATSGMLTPVKRGNFVSNCFKLLSKESTSDLKAALNELNSLSGADFTKAIVEGAAGTILAVLDGKENA